MKNARINESIMKWIGLTGGIATGKSSVAKYLKEINRPIISADKLAEKALLKGSQTYTQVLNLFGESILDENRNIQKKKLGRKVFSDKNLLSQLELIVHPFVREQVQREKDQFKALNCEICFYEIPLLFEKNLQDDFDKIVLVYASKDHQKRRMKKRDGLTEKEIENRLRNQIPIENKIKKSHFVIDNEGSFNELKEKIQKVLKKLIKEPLSNLEEKSLHR